MFHRHRRTCRPGQRQPDAALSGIEPQGAAQAAAFLPAIPALALLIAGFLMQGLWDVMSVDAGRLPSWFGRLRMILTGGAVISLVAALLAVLVI